MKELFAGRKSLVRAGGKTGTLSSIYVFRPLSEKQNPILFLLHAPKKNIPKAHDRNKMKRWIREALMHSGALDEIRSRLLEKEVQALVLIRSDFRPSKDHAWQQIVGDVRIITGLLLKKITS